MSSVNDPLLGGSGPSWCSPFVRGLAVGVSLVCCFGIGIGVGIAIASTTAGGGGGGDNPALSPWPSSTPTVSVTPSVTRTPTRTITRTATVSVTPTISVTAGPSATPLPRPLPAWAQMYGDRTLSSRSRLSGPSLHTGAVRVDEDTYADSPESFAVTADGMVLFLVPSQGKTTLYGSNAQLEQQWEYPLPYSPCGMPTLVGDLVILSTASELLALRLSGGSGGGGGGGGAPTKAWSVPQGNTAQNTAPSCPTVGLNRTVVVVDSMAGTATAHHTSSGAVVWQTELPAAAPQPPSADDDIFDDDQPTGLSFTPAIGGAQADTVFVTGLHGSIARLRADDGAVVWNVTLGHVRAVTRDDTVVVATHTALVGLAASDGSQRWSVPTPDGVIGVAVGSNDWVYITSASNVVAVNRTGDHMWQSGACEGNNDDGYSQGIATPSVLDARGVLYFGTQSYYGGMCALNATTGAIVWQWDDSPRTSTMSTTPAIGMHGAMYAGTSGSVTYAPFLYLWPPQGNTTAG